MSDRENKTMKYGLSHDLLKHKIVAGLENLLSQVNSEHYSNLLENNFWRNTLENGNEIDSYFFRVKDRNLNIKAAVRALKELREDERGVVKENKPTTITFNDVISCVLGSLNIKDVVGVAMDKNGKWHYYTHASPIGISITGNWCCGGGGDFYYIKCNLKHPDWTKSWIPNPNYKKEITFDDVYDDSESIFARGYVLGVAMDKDGRWCAYAKKEAAIEEGNAYWNNRGGSYCNISYGIHHPDWRKSWIPNPNYKSKEDIAREDFYVKFGNLSDNILGVAMDKDGEWYAYSNFQPFISQGDNHWAKFLSLSTYLCGSYQYLTCNEHHPDWAKSWIPNPNYRQR